MIPFRRMLTVLLPAALVLFIAAPAWPTAQLPDTILYQGKTENLLSNPLETYFSKENPRPAFTAPHTACWRGYVATWVIRNDTLFLADIHAWMRDENGKVMPVGFEKVFPGREKPLKAQWFTGTLRIPQGEPLRYVHMGYRSEYEKEILLRIEAGKVVERKVIDNREPAPGKKD